MIGLRCYECISSSLVRDEACETGWGIEESVVCPSSTDYCTVNKIAITAAYAQVKRGCAAAAVYPTGTRRMTDLVQFCRSDYCNTGISPFQFNSASPNRHTLTAILTNLTNRTIYSELGPIAASIVGIVYFGYSEFVKIVGYASFALFIRPNFPLFTALSI